MMYSLTLRCTLSINAKSGCKPYPSVIADDDYQRDQEEDEDVDEDKVFRSVFVFLTDNT